MKKNQKNEQNKDIYVNQNLLNIISPSGISFDNNYADIGEGVGKIFCISRYPSELDYGWLSDIVNLPGAAATVEYRYSPEDIMIAQFNRRISELKSARETERKESEIQRYEHQIRKQRKSKPITDKIHSTCYRRRLESRREHCRLHVG